MTPLHRALDERDEARDERNIARSEALRMRMQRDELATLLRDVLPYSCPPDDLTEQANEALRRIGERT